MEFNGTFLASIISFVLFVYLMNKVLYEPMRKIVNERNGFIAENYNIADTNDKKSESLKQEMDEKLLEAKEDARNTYNDTISSFKEKRAEIVREAQEASKENVSKAYEQLNNVSNEAKQSLKNQIISLAEDISEKILGYRSGIDGFDNEKVDEILYH